MTRLEAVTKAFISYYETKYPEYVLCAEDEDRICAMQAALNAADAWKDDVIKDAETKAIRPFAQSFIVHFEAARGYSSYKFTSEMRAMVDDIACALEKAFEERERK